MYSHILFPTDGSDCAQHALDTVIALAKAYGSRVTVLHAVQLPFPSSTPALGMSPGQAFSVQEISDIFEHQARTLLDQTVAHLQAAGVSTQSQLSHKDPREAIQDTVASEA